MNTSTWKDFNRDAITTELAGIEIITEPSQIAKLSLDYYHFSPILLKLAIKKLLPKLVKARVY